VWGIRKKKVEVAFVAYCKFHILLDICTLSWMCCATRKAAERGQQQRKKELVKKKKNQEKRNKRLGGMRSALFSKLEKLAIVQKNSTESSDAYVWAM
jgi:hypothetical protein